MPLVRFLAASLLVALAACATTAQRPGQPNVYVMRHLQKAEGPDPALTAEGQANAQRLASWFGRNPPRVIYVSSTRRAQQTAAPLAAKLGIAPKVYDPSDSPGLVARVMQETGTVLIIGHSNTVPEIVERLGGTRPAAIADDSFGDIWLVSGADRKVEKRSLGG